MPSDNTTPNIDPDLLGTISSKANKQKIDFDQILTRTGTNSKRWDLVQEQYQSELIPLGIADTDFPVPSEVIDAIQKRLTHPCFGYSYPSDNLKKAIVHYLSTKYHWDIDPNWIVFYPDATTSLYFIFHGLGANPHSHVLLQPPIFGPFFNDIQRAGLSPLSVPLLFDGQHYSMDFPLLEKTFQETPSISALILCNPHNPIGRIWQPEELQKLAEICIQYQCPIISDELHSDLIHPSYKHTPIASLSNDIAQNTITLFSPGKGFNIAGLKISIAIIPNDTMRQKIQFITNNMDPNTLALVAYETILTESIHTYTPLLVEYIAENFRYMDDYFKKYIPSLRLIPAQATFLAWVDMRALGIDQLHDFFINEAKICVSYGHSFGEGGEGFARFNIGIPKSLLQKALEQLRLAVDSLPKQTALNK